MIHLKMKKVNTMQSEVIHIKNMVCDRCILVVSQLLGRLNIAYQDIGLGEVFLRETLSEDEKAELQEALLELGFELIDNKRGQVIETIKTKIILFLNNMEDFSDQNLSSYLTHELPYDYNYLSNLFSEVEGISIERYYISQRTEKAIELLAYDQLSIKEISHQLGYSSPAHFSNQFKKVTGLSPSHFKGKGYSRRRPLDKL